MKNINRLNKKFICQKINISFYNPRQQAREHICNICGQEGSILIIQNQAGVAALWQSTCLACVEP